MRRKLTISIAAAAAIFMMANNPVLANWRSEERSVVKECVLGCRSRW